MSYEPQSTTTIFGISLSPSQKLELYRFLRYSLVGLSTFGFDLVLLFIFVDFFAVSLMTATLVAFFIAASINYSISRYWVFAGTERGVTTGYLNFLSAAIVAGLSIALIVVLLVEYANLYYPYARVIAAMVIGVGNYLFNLFLNFKTIGKKLR